MRQVSPCVVVSLENVVMDINELVKGMEMTRREYEARKERDPPPILKDFLANSDDKLSKLKVDTKTAQVSVSIWLQLVLLAQSIDNLFQSYIVLCDNNNVTYQMRLFVYYWLMLRTDLKEVGLCTLRSKTNLTELRTLAVDKILTVVKGHYYCSLLKFSNERENVVCTFCPCNLQVLVSTTFVDVCQMSVIGSTPLCVSVVGHLCAGG